MIESQAPSKQFHLAMLAVLSVTFVMALFRFDGPAKGYWDTYITAPAMFMNKVPVDFVLKDGAPAFEPVLRGMLPDDLVDKNDFGIITKDQRLGGGITASLPFAVFGQFGFRVLFAFVVMLLIPLTWMVCRELSPGSDWHGLFAGIVLAWNPYVLNVDRLNANLFSMPLILLLIYSLVKYRERVVYVGLIFGVLAGIRNEAVCFVPAICFWYLQSDLRDGFGRRFSRLTLVGLFTVIGLLPILYWKWYAFGHPLMHPSQYAHFQGFRPEFPHSLFGLGFTFNGLFNWPLHSELVRTPHFGYPTYFLFPLVTTRAFGLLMSALILWGGFLMWRRQRSVAILLIVWMVPVYLLFGPQENWEEVKMTFMLLAWPPLVVFLAHGLQHFLDKAQFTRRLGTLVLISVVLFGGIQWLGTVHVPQDQRWYVRFPNANAELNPEAQEGLSESERNDWRYFQSYETAAEIEIERAKLTAGLPWPATYLPLDWNFSREWNEMATEVSTRKLTVLEIWGYIYGTRR